MGAPSVTIVGGGLAGLVSAWRLLECGCKVSLYEQSGRLGGKAGATRFEHGSEEHGYHIFPAWYRNVRKLVEELGIENSFRDCTQFLQLHPGKYPKFLPFTNITSARYVWSNLTAGVLSVPETFLFFYAALDLMSQPYSYRAALDQVTVTGFLRSRFYRTERIAGQFQDLMLKGISVPTYEVSAMTMRNVMRFWVKRPEPMHRILKGDLQSLWIEPIRQKILELGGSIHLGMKLTRVVTEGDQVRALTFANAGGEAHELPVESVLLAIPVEKLTAVLDDPLYASAPALGELRNLRTRPMTAFNIYFKRKIPNMPNAHINLLDSRYGISFLDVSQTWPSLETTVLNLIASDVSDLESLSGELAVGFLMEDLKRYIPFHHDDVELITFQSHAEQPLFMNNVGGWEFRPRASTQVKNLYLAGDYCRNPIDLVSMEGAVSSGLLAAEAIRSDYRLPKRVEVLDPEVYPRWLTVLGRLALLPVAALAKAWMLLKGPSPETASADVPPTDVRGLPIWPVRVIDESAAPKRTGEQPLHFNG
jgi:uncharacterized protein with NAD-binding domain and iron-sulfur cluster